MSASGNTFWSDRAEARKWIGRIVMAVIFGEAIWHLIASVMDYVVVPWLGDFMGQSSGLPTSFTQRPYDYPDLFVSLLEFCIAAIVAISINWYFQRPGKPVRVQARPATVVVPQVVGAAPPVAFSEPSVAVPPEPVYRPVVTSTVVAPPTAIPVVRPTAVAPPPPPKPVVVAAPPPAPPKPVVPVVPATPAPVVTKPTPAPPPPSQPAKKKEVYYNIVGDPISGDED